MQRLLLRSAFFDGPLTGKWDTATSAAFARYTAQTDTGNAKTKRDFIALLETYSLVKRSTVKPAWLLIFADPEKKLALLQEEKEIILGMLKNAAPQLQAVLIVLENPSRAEITAVMKDPANRGRIELVYYSGFDDVGEFRLTDGTFTLPELAALLDYQENIVLLAANTCRSTYLASTLNALGVQNTIGSEGQVLDDYARDFGVHLFDSILKKTPLSRLKELQNNQVFKGSGDKAYEDKYSLFSSPESSEQWPEHWYKRGRRGAQLD